MSNEELILPSIHSLSVNSASVPSKNGFGYNPWVGPLSNAINQEASHILMSKKTITVAPKATPSIYDRNINKKVPEISMSALSFLFCEIVSWAMRKSKGVQELEERLNILGYQIGQRFLELIKIREGIKYSKREVRILEMLQFIHGQLWKAIFGRTANDLEKSRDVSDEYMIIDDHPLMSKYINIPKEYGNLNCSAFTAGIIEGALDSAFFHATVTAHSAPKEDLPCRTVFLIKFEDLVFTREELRFNA